MHTKKLCSSIFLIAVSLSTSAQRTAIYDASVAKFEEALMLYDAGMYGSARSCFESIQPSLDADLTDGQIAEDAQYFTALCAKFLNNADATVLLNNFQLSNQHNQHRSQALYHLGDHHLSNGNIRKALDNFETANEDALPSDERRHLIFKKGYCQFMQGNHTLAVAQFDKIRGNEGEYANAISYYRAHVDYENGNLDDALKAFATLEKDEGFSQASSYYIAHILYLKGNYADALRYARPLSEQKGNKTAEMLRIVADCHFMTAEYSAAISVYNKLQDTYPQKVSRNDLYHLGMSYFNTADYKRATEYLSKVTNENDETAQNAYYNLAASYIKLGDKKRARTAFEAAARSGFDPAITEDAHFNKLKLAYELNFSPFDEIISSLVEFVELYPAGAHRDEAYNLMSKAFVSSKNYKKALQTMEKIQHKDLALYQALQRISFYRGLELYAGGNTDEASEFFDYSMRYADYDAKIKARTYYWQAEGLYNKGNITEARDKYIMFINAYNATEVDEFPMAHYNVGYTYFNQKDYLNARRWFLRYVNLAGHKNEQVEADANNRIGDCLYVDRDFSNALTYYDKAIALSPSQGDYSMLQKAVCMGLQNNHQGKIVQLDNLIGQYPKSVYVDNAYFEKARAYVALGNIKDAIYNYKVVKENYPKGSLAPQAMLQLGLLYYNNGEYDNSMAFYKRVVNEYPSTPIANDALAGLRNIYMERGDYDGYIAYTATLGSFAHVNMSERDSLLFVSANHLYLNSQRPEAKVALQRYLQTFPDGRYVTPANYYLADCYYVDGQKDEALKLYEAVAAQPRSIFTEESLLRSGELLYHDNQYDKALVYLRRLEEEAEVESNRIEAVIGQMRCLRKLGNTAECLAGAEKVIIMPQASPEILREAQYLKAQCLIETGRSAEAQPTLRILAENTRSVEGAEAKYLIAEYLYNANNKDEAEKEIFDYVEHGTPHQYWLARSFVLLSDIYRDKGEYFQAQQYLQLLRDSYTEKDDIENMISDRLATLAKLNAEPQNTNKPQGSSSLPE